MLVLLQHERIRRTAKTLAEGFNSLENREVHRYDEHAGGKSADATAPGQPYTVDQVYLHHQKCRSPAEANLCSFRPGGKMVRLSGELESTKSFRLTGIVMER